MNLGNLLLTAEQSVAAAEKPAEKRYDPLTAYNAAISEQVRTILEL